ncbi:MAG: LysM peptidoglycan-binding domain-containing protein, partial [Epsilonproteobacteria bacterium]|nr:LysM peptidoglycan-binding domain-containing protein [Campylobacterota bacterium]
TIDRNGPSSLDELHTSVVIRFLSKEKYLPEQQLYRPKSLEKLEKKLFNISCDYDESDYEIALYNRDNREVIKEDSKKVTINGKEFYVYTVKKGDTLSSISRNITGKASNYKKIQKDNEVSIPNENIIYIGQRIFISLDLVQ